MREAMAITGYLPTKEIRAINEESSFDIRPEKDAVSVLMRVSGRDVEDVRVGAKEDGYSLVQLILRDGTEIETVARHNAAKGGLTPFHDPVLNKIDQEAIAKVIMI